MIFELDLPPSSNGRLIPTIRRGRPSLVMAPAYRQWLDYAVRALTEGQPDDWEPFSGPVCCLVEVRFPDRHRRDIDNLLKPLNDALTQARVWEDDSLVSVEVIRRGPVEKPGIMRVAVWPLSTFNPLQNVSLFDFGEDDDGSGNCKGLRNHPHGGG